MLSNYGISDSAAAWIIAGVILLGIIVAVLRNQIARKVIDAAAQRRVPPIEIARIEESSQFTNGGAIAVILMAVFNFTALLTYYSAATALQQTVAALSAISASVFWGVFVLVGRRHTYRVLRDPPTEERIEP